MASKCNNLDAGQDLYLVRLVGDAGFIRVLADSHEEASEKVQRDRDVSQTAIGLVRKQ